MCVFNLDLNTVSEQLLVTSMARELQTVLCNGKHDQQSEFLWSACTVAVQQTSGDDEQIPEV